MPTTIYALRDPRTDEVRYVGKTSGPLKDRVAAHLVRAQRPRTRTRVCCWLRGLLADGLTPEVEVLELVVNESWVEAERRWIAHYRRLGDLCNMTDGGEGAPGGSRSGWKHTSEARAKLSEAKRGRPHSPEHRRNLAASLARLNRDPAHIASAATSTRGQKRSAEARARMAAAQRGKTLSPTTRLRISEALKGDPRLRHGKARRAPKLALDVSVISAEYRDGGTLAEIAARRGVSEGLILKRLRAAGVPRRARGPRKQSTNGGLLLCP